MHRPSSINRPLCHLSTVHSVQCNKIPHEPFSLSVLPFHPPSPSSSSTVAVLLWSPPSPPGKPHSCRRRNGSPAPSFWFWYGNSHVNPLFTQPTSLPFLKRKRNKQHYSAHFLLLWWWRFGTSLRSFGLPLWCCDLKGLAISSFWPRRLRLQTFIANLNSVRNLFSISTTPTNHTGTLIPSASTYFCFGLQCRTQQKNAYVVPRHSTPAYDFSPWTETHSRKRHNLSLLFYFNIFNIFYCFSFFLSFSSNFFLLHLH